MHSEDYKRGLLDMLDALTVTSNSGAITARYREEYDWRSANGVTPLRIALEYREELENRKTILSAIELLTKKGYTIFDPGDEPKPPMLSQEQMIRLLQNDGYSIMYPSQPETNVEWSKSSEPSPRRLTSDEMSSVIRSGSALHNAVGHEEDEGD